jgi:GNAT superfamily N-acetyltransferase
MFAMSLQNRKVAGIRPAISHGRPCPLIEGLIVRPARICDREPLREMQALAFRVLGAGFYTSAQIESFLTHLGSLDDFLLVEGTYYVAEVAGLIVASGGWSLRVPNYCREIGADGSPSPKIRSVYVHPMWARRGLAHHLVLRAEAEACAAGHGEITLAATLSGMSLYTKLAFEAGEDIILALPDLPGMQLVSMRKKLTPGAATGPYSAGA